MRNLKFFAVSALAVIEFVIILALLTAWFYKSPGRVTEVKDGDTVVIAMSNRYSIDCRLYGIDAPEIGKGKRAGQPYGEEVKRELERMVLYRKVSVELTGKKTFNRDVCLIEKGGLDVNLEMVRAGYAWSASEYLDKEHKDIYMEAERKAREKKLGLWQDVNPEPPWEFRKKTKKHKKIK